MRDTERPQFYHRDGTPIAGQSVLDWAIEFEKKKERIVRQEKNIWGEKISTVFLGLDHNYGLDGPPLIFETMVFHKGGSDCFMDRYSTEAEAIHGHEHAVKLSYFPRWIRRHLFSGWY